MNDTKDGTNVDNNDGESHNVLSTTGDGDTQLMGGIGTYSMCQGGITSSFSQYPYICILKTSVLP